MFTSVNKNTLLLVMLAFLLLTLLSNVFIGAFSISFDDIKNVFINPKENKLIYEVLVQIRIPRVLLGLVVGIAFGLCGSIMQTLFKNPLADPSLIGVSSGASAGVVLYMMVAGFLPILSNEFFSSYFSVPLSAFLGAIITIYVIYKLSNVYGKVSVSIMLLSGIALNSLLGALIGIFTYISDDTALRSFTFWTLGSLNGANFSNILILVPINIFILIVVLLKKNDLNLLLLGEDEAKNSGVNVEILKKVLVVCVALGIGVSVAFCGIIAFVGLVVPHISRLIIGSNHKYYLPFSAMFGGFVMIWADTISRTMIQPSELPIGIITSILGAPFFIWLLLKSKKEMVI